MSYHKIVRCDKCEKTQIFTEKEDDYEHGYRLFSFVDHHESRHFNLCPDCMKWFYENVGVQSPQEVEK